MRPKTSPGGRVLAAILILASLGSIFMTWITLPFLEGSFFDVLQAAVKDNFGSDTENAIVIVLGILLGLTGLIGLISALCGAKGGVVPYLLASLLYLGGAIYLASAANREITSSIGIPLDAVGISVAGKGIGAYLCPALALLAFFCMLIPDRSYPPYPGGYAAAYGGSVTINTGSFEICPVCGAQHQAGSAFCPNCGAAKPQSLRCPVCGAQLQPGAGFCSNCGAQMR